MKSQNNGFHEINTKLKFVQRIQCYRDQIEEINKSAIKKAKRFIPIANQCIYVFNYVNFEFVYFSPEVETVTGYPASYFNRIDTLASIIHPDDKLFVKNAILKTLEAADKVDNSGCLEHYFHLDYRIVTKEGEVKRLQRQSAKLTGSPTGEMLTSIGILSDITHLKKSNEVSMLMTGPEIPNYTYSLEKHSTANFSDREKQIIDLLVKSKTSSEIGQILFISRDTVDTHRRNILKKAGVKNTVELIARVLKYGL